MSLRMVMVAGLMLALSSSAGWAQKKYDTGASDTEIKIGQTMPYSGPLSTYSTIGKLDAAYFGMVNKAGGINGRRIDLISVDDGYSPPKTVEQVRRLVERDGVLLTFSTMGTPTNVAIQKYLNARKIPMLFVAAGASKWNDPTHFPWTMPWPQSYFDEGRQYATYVKASVTNPKIGILSQDDDLGRDFIAGFREGLGADADKLIVKELNYQPTDPSIDSQIISLQASGANVFFDVTVSKFAAQAIHIANELGWHPLHLLISNSNAIGTTLTVAGLAASQGIVSSLTYKDPLDPQWAHDPDVADYLKFMKTQYPAGDVKDYINAYAYAAAHLMVRVLQLCGDNLTRANVLYQATHLHDLRIPMLLPGILINTSPTNYAVLAQSRLARFDGKKWVLIEQGKAQ